MSPSRVGSAVTKDLAKHQAALVADMLGTLPPTRRLLVAPVGLGKTHTAVALAKRIADEGGKYRILVIGPKPLMAMYEHRLRDALPDAHIAAVSRQIFRELEDAASGEQPVWPAPFVAIFGMDTARQDDVRAALCSVTWDLVILDEVHLFARSRWTLLKTIISQEAFARVLLITSTPEVKGVASLLKNVPTIQWKIPEGMNRTSRPESQLLPAKVVLVTYQRTDEEASLLRAVLTLANELSSTPAGKLAKHTLLRQASSSPVALERTVRRWRNLLAHGSANALLDGTTREPIEDDFALDADDDIYISSTGTLGAWLSRARALNSLNELVDKLELVARDSKREAFEGLLKQLQAELKARLWHVCVFCSSMATANYLHSSIANRGLKAWLLTTESTSEQLGIELEGFQKNGGVLITTTAMLRGMDLRDADVFIHYDPSGSADEEYVRASRGPHAANYVLVDESGLLPTLVRTEQN